MRVARVSDGESNEVAQQATLQSMRQAFASGDYDEVIAGLDDLGGPTALKGGIRIEAVVLAARAHIAQGTKRDARTLLKTVWGRTLKHPRQYRSIAIACLELEDYSRAAQLTAKAAELADDKRAAARTAEASAAPQE